MTPLDPDRTIALSYVPANRRAGVAALWHLDAALGAVLKAGKEPAISQIKLVWWRDALERLDNKPAPPEPILRAVAQHVLPRGVSGAALSALTEGWTVLLAEEALNTDELDAYASGRGGALFRMTAALLGAPADDRHVRAGEVWALTDLARNSGNPDAQAALERARDRAEALRWPNRLRPLGMLAALAARDAAAEIGRFEVQGSPARMLRMLRHRVTGR